MRYFLDIAYNGTNYHGWQKQNNAHTVQDELESRLCKILRLDEIQTTGSGRTDTGVHAFSQFVHFDFPEKLDHDFFYKLNSFLPKDIAINQALLAENDLVHARFSATAREYKYFIHTKKSPFLNDRSWYIYRKLDVKAMKSVTSQLIGNQDFASFCKKAEEYENTLCELTQAEWKVENAQLVLTISANRFLRGMIRAIVGTLVQIGSGNIHPSKFESIIATKDRKSAASAAPAHGLFLSKIKYENDRFERIF